FIYNTSQHHKDMIFMMLTSIIDESTTLLCYGKNCEKIVQYAFTKQLTDGKVELPGVVSRKKQLVPALMTGIQMMMQ
ncbi:MAG: DHHA2 domain-containing protein, partial [Lachnospiraceae bacterium]|nr:DHHA2 domain-containing protein [Lachnospiraceae bacterium]